MSKKSFYWNSWPILSDFVDDCESSAQETFSRRFTYKSTLNSTVSKEFRELVTVPRPVPVKGI